MPLTGPELRALRLKLKMTQVELAKEVGLTSVSISRFEQPTGANPVPHWLGLLLFHMVKDAEEERKKGA